MHAEDDDRKVRGRKSAFAIKKSPMLDQVVTEIFAKLLTEIMRKTGHCLNEFNGVKLVNFARHADNTLCHPGVLTVQCDTEETRDW